MRKNKTNRPTGFSGYYVEIPEGGDAMRGYRKIKKWIKNDRFLEELRDRQYYRKPSEIKREAEKKRKKTLHNSPTEKNFTFLLDRCWSP